MFALLLCACRRQPEPVRAAIEFTRVPEAHEGGSQQLVPIEGRAIGARPGQRIVLFARSGVWWVQPLANQPFTPLQPDATWKSSTHLGTEYAALLVERDYEPPATTEALPAVGGAVAAVAIVAGRGPWVPRVARTLHFSGYEWAIRHRPSNRGGDNAYDPANAWIDASGFLHLRISRAASDWASAEVSLTRSLGYGTYSFVVRDTSHLEPAATLSMFTWDDLGAEQNHRELDIEISRWGDAANKNAQFLIQPYYVPANVFRFAAPAGRLTHAFRWEPARVSFKTTRASVAGAPRVVSTYDFTSGVPSPGGEAVHINLYVFRFSAVPLQKEAEVVIEKFEYLP